MARVADVVSDTVKEITAQLKEIKQSDNDDLNEIAESFDRIAERADQASGSLTKADQALTGEQADEEENGNEEQQDEEAA